MEKFREIEGIGGNKLEEDDKAIFNRLPTVYIGLSKTLVIANYPRISCADIFQAMPKLQGLWLVALARYYSNRRRVSLGR